MRQRREVCVLFKVAIVCGLILVSSSASAQINVPLEAGKARKFGIGGDLSAVNFSMGPMVKYWVTDNIGTQLTYSAIGGLTGYSLKGIYEFAREINLAGEGFNPYLGIGYTSVSKKDNYGGSSLTYKGSGPSFSGGLEGSLKQLHPNLYYTAELAYSPFDLEGKYKTQVPVWDYWGNVSYEQHEETVKEDLSSFGVGISVIYYF